MCTGVHRGHHPASCVVDWDRDGSDTVFEFLINQAPSPRTGPLHFRTQPVAIDNRALSQRRKRCIVEVGI
ncbi:MAG TPA: hypothetical protein VJN19_02355, partial [Propionibacteriaceae bacterium]|nr:hypothetical protein [Propionibacteriaceae bacterium]